MVTAEFEAQLASEGATGSAEEQLAFQEAFALAENVSVKMQLVEKTFVPGTPDFLFYSALCTLLEVQILVEEGKHELAWQKLGDTKLELEIMERELTGRSCWRRTQRVQRRRLLLELDLLCKLKKPDEDIKNVTQEITRALLVVFQDPEPEGVTTEIRKETFPTALNEELLNLDAIIQIKLGALDYSTTKGASLKEILNNLDVFGREKVFQKVLAWNGDEKEHWEMLDVFLDDMPFEFTDVPGYVDIIIQDVQRRKNKDPFKDYSFNFRAVHPNMPFSQLLECARKKPELFRCNKEFAVRGIQLLRAAAEVDITQDPVLDSGAQKQKELQHLGTFLEFLRDFTPSAVGSLQVMILYRKLEVLNVICWMNSNAVTELQNCLVEYVKIAGGRTLNAFDFIGSCGFDTVSQAHHNQIICKSLTTLWSFTVDGKAVFAMLSSYLDSAFLDGQHALSMIKLGKGKFSEWAEKLKANGQQLSSDSSSAQVIFCESNPAFFMPDDPLRIHVRTRNIKSLTAHLYEIKVTEYYSRLRREIKGDICLDGLLPTEEQVINLSHLTQWQESRVPIEFRTTKASPRGVFVVEVFEKGITCRAILRKGFLRHVERVTTQGHEFTVLDERGNLLLDARAMLLNVKSGNSRAQHGREYAPDEDGKIIIPFRHPKEGIASDRFAIAFCHGSFGTFHGSFSYLAESFAVDVDMHIDYEQLLPGSIAQLVTRPRLLVAGIATGEPLDFIVGVKLVIEFNLVNTSNVGSSSHKVVLSFASMQQIVDEPPCFEIPMDSASFTITLDAHISRKNEDQDSAVKLADFPKVYHSKRFEVQRVNDFDVTSTAHFVRKPLEPGNPYSPSQFSVLVVGHNGEPVPNAQVDLAFKHVHASAVIPVTLQTDSAGEVNLGQLQNIERFEANLGARTGFPRSCSWELPNLRSYRPQIVNCSVDETVEIPMPFAFSTSVEEWVIAKMVSVCEVVDTVLQNSAHFSNVTVVKNALNLSVGIAVRISRPGKYVVYIRPLNLKFPVTVCEQKQKQASFPSGLIIQPTQVVLATSTLPLAISSQKLRLDDEKKLVLEIQLRNATKSSTHVLVWLKTFLDMRSKTVSEVLVADGLAPVTSSGSHLPKLNFHSSPLENDFLKMRKVSDEYAYILQRRALVSSNEGSLLLLGSPLLPRPSLLQNPMVIGESEMEVVTTEAGDKVTGFKSVGSREIQSGGHAPRRCMTRKRCSFKSSIRYQNLEPSISFLGKQSQLLASSVMSLDGVVRFELSGLPFFSREMGSFEVCAVAFDTEGGNVCSQQLAMTLPERDNALILPKRDIRLSVEEALAPLGHFHQVDSHESVRAGDVKTIPRSFSSKYALYDSLTSAINLWPTLTPGSEVSELATKLNEWWGLSLQEKNSFYYGNACDDFHFYLFRKDPDFFQQFAKPLVEAKVCKSLMDHYVLGDEASLRQLFLGPASFQRLSCVEKLLIAERMTDVELKTQICKAVIREIDSNYPFSCTALPALFNTILSQGQVEPSAAQPPPIEQASGGLFGAPPAAMAQRMHQFGYSPASPAYSPASASFAPGGVSNAQPSFGSSGVVNLLSSSHIIEETTESLNDADYFMDDDDFGVRSLGSESDEEEADDGDDDDQDLDKENKKKRKKVKQELPYIPPGKVRKVQEKRFFSGQYPLLSGCNKFWREYAEYICRLQTGGERFVSSYFPEALVSITEGLFALAVLDLDIDSKPTQAQLFSAVGTQVTLSSLNNAVLYRRSIGPAECDSTANGVLILKQRNEDENGDSNTEFLVNKIYTTVVTLSNIGSEQLTNVNLLLQIPRGAVPMGSTGFYTKNEIGTVAPNHTSEFRFSFYFPEVGTFEQYPARASLDGMIIGWAQTEDGASSCKVVRTATRVNLTSWTDVSARGSLQEVVQFMDSVLPGVTIDYQKLLWRCHDKTFFHSLLNYLRSKMIFEWGVWKYGLLHRDEQTMREYLTSLSELSQSVGSGFSSSFVDNSRLYHVERYASVFERFDHCEFGPFLTRRVHPVTGRVNSEASLLFSAKTLGKRILNADARQFFGELCQRLGAHTRMSGQHLLVMAYYMIIFDRIEDAIKIITRLDVLTDAESSKMKATVQYAYLVAFLDFFRSRDHQGRAFAFARQAVASYITHPQPRWRNRFEKMQEFLEEYDAFEVQSLGQLQDMEMVDASAESDKPNRDNMPNSRGNQVKLEASVGEGAVELLSEAIGLCEVAFYPIDVELMFSTEPFNTFSDSAASSSSLLLVEPRQQISVSLNTTAADSSMAKTVVRIPDELHASQMMVRVREVTSSRTVKREDVSSSDADMAEKASIAGGHAESLNDLDDPDAGKTLEERAAIDKKLMWKVDRWLIPWLCLLYLLSFLDRTNIGNARLAQMEPDLGMGGHDYNNALTIFFISYALAEPVTNVLLKRLTPRVFFTGIILLWGLIMTLMGLVKNYSGLLACRFFLGLAEAGLFPGVNYYLSCWYKRSELGLRAATFFSAAALAGSFGGLLAAAIALMDGVGGMDGWAWIFIIEGLATMFVGAFCWWMVFDWPSTAGFLTPEERIRVRRRLAADNQSNTAEEYDRRHVYAALKDWKCWGYAVIYMGCLMPLYAFSLFLPTIIGGMGHKGTRAQLLTVPPYAVAATVTIIVGYLGDRTRQRAILNMIVVVIGIAGFTMLIASANPTVQYVGTFLGAVGIYPTIPNTLSWCSNNIEGIYKRGVIIGIVVGSGNLNGVVSSNIFLVEEKPRYWTGHGMVLGYMTVFLLGGTVFMWAMLKRENAKRRSGARDNMHAGKTTDEIWVAGDNRPDFIYSL